MKKLAILILSALFLITGCQDDKSILEPDNNYINAELTKGRPIFNYDNSDGLDDLDLNFDYDYATKKFSFVTKNFTVDGSKGDELIISESSFKDGKLISMSAKLTIPAKAFKGTKNFDIIFDFYYYSVELYPSPFIFNKPVILDLSFYGVDFSNLDSDNLNFEYLDGENEVLKYADITINKSWKVLSIKGAELSHFSRYGWTRTTTSK